MYTRPANQEVKQRGQLLEQKVEKRSNRSDIYERNVRPWNDSHVRLGQSNSLIEVEVLTSESPTR